jgi:hypothetical protein
MTETYWLPQDAVNIASTDEHTFDLTGDYSGVTGVCTCGYVFTGVTTVKHLFQLVRDHSKPIAADYLP